MVIEVRRYLGNTLSAHIHDADHESANCRLGRIAPDHRRRYDTLEEARADSSYEDCSWCMGGSAGHHATQATASAGTA